MSISSPGVGSGLDIAGIVRQLMSIERRPLLALQQRVTQFNTQLSAYGRLKSALESFRSAMENLASTDKFQVYSATSGDEDAFTATASSSANVGSFSIKVNALAANHRMASATIPDSGTTTIGNSGDTMTITVNGKSFAVDIGGKTLSQIRSAINSATDNVGVTASILKENDTSYRLILSADESGTANAISLDFTNGGLPITDPLTMATTVAAANASLLIDDTFTVTSSSNTFSDAIEGVTLTVKATTATNVSLTIAKDLGAIQGSTQAFADAYNTLRSTIQDLRKGTLKSDNALLSIESRIRGILNTPPTGLSGSFRYLAQVGLAIQKDGTMTLDADTLETALTTDFSAVADLFANDGQGFAYRLEAAADEMLSTGGIIESREKGINDRISSNQDQQASLEYRLQLIEERYRRQFGSLDTLLGQLQTTSNYLTRQLSLL